MHASWLAVPSEGHDPCQIDKVGMCLKFVRFWGDMMNLAVGSIVGQVFEACNLAVASQIC